MRRILHSQSSEPQIVIEDNIEEEHDQEEQNTLQNLEAAEKMESPTLNPFFLSPYSRDTRKHSLPTPQCSGITASQIRRLSDRGGGAENGNSGHPGPRQTEFLATLSQAPQVSPGGRRHSVVTISKVAIKTRRESAFAGISAFPARILPNRRESIAYCPPSEPHGSVHNLHLDIMDDIVQARKVRMKVWTTSSEKLCEVQPIDESSISQRYTRRFSDFIAGSTLPTIPSSAAAAKSSSIIIKRRASELPSASSKQKTGIVCSNSDLVSILSSVSTSTTQLQHQQISEIPILVVEDDYQQQQINQLQNSSNKLLHNKIEAEPSNSSSVIDPELLGTAIEGFLRKTPNNDVCEPSSSSSSSLCGSLKDLFVKGVAKSVTTLGHSLYNNN